MNDTIHTIRRSAGIFFSGTLLSRISGMIRDVTMAYVFGTHPSVSVFMVAFRFAHLLRRIFGEGAMQSAFIPGFESLRSKNEEKGLRFFRDLTASVSLLLFLIILLGMGGIGAYLYFLNPHSSYKEMLILTLIMLPGLLFICLFGLNASFLQCEGKYFTSSAAPIVFNCIWIAAAISLSSMSAEKAMPLLSFGVIIACLCQWMVTMPQTISILKKGLKAPFKNQIQWFSPDIQGLIKPLFLGILGVSASQVNNAIDPLFAWHADSEGPALLWYAIRIQQLPLALFGVAISGAILPPLSRALKSNRQEEYLSLLQYAFFRTWALMLPITIAIFLMGDVSISLVYGRGDFQAESIIGTTQCLWAYGLGLLPSALILVLAPACYANNHYRLTTIASFINLFLNIILNSVFIFWYQWGASSVALATSISAWINLLYLAWSLKQRETNFYTKDSLYKGGGILFAASIAAMGTYFFRMHVQDLHFFASKILHPSSLFDSTSVLLTQAGIFLGLFFALNYFLNRILKNPKDISEKGQTNLNHN